MNGIHIDGGIWRKMRFVISRKGSARFQFSQIFCIPQLARLYRIFNRLLWSRGDSQTKWRR